MRAFLLALVALLAISVGADYALNQTDVAAVLLGPGDGARPPE